LPSGGRQENVPGLATLAEDGYPPAVGVFSTVLDNGLG
jgi:hypothetical protein